ncbi:MAG: cellulosome protein, partial [Prevotella sp.]|nr:cellulosome protein [Prevotella sp.]
MKKFFLLTILCVLGVESASAQRIQQPLGRGVVVSTRNSERDVTSTAGTGTLVSWRKLADEPENTIYNLYSRPVGATAYTKINTQPIPNTCYELTSAPKNTEYAVTAIVNGIEGNTSQPFLYRSQKWSNVWFQFEFDNSVIKRNDYRTKYVWPMDTDGDGEIDAVVCDRLFSGAAENDDAENQEENTSSTSHKLQAYRLDGTLLWTIDMGPNVSICGGHNDMVVAYDINCDGKCEVVMRSSDGTRFWDKQNNTWGLFVGGSTTGDIDGDGIIDYRNQGKRNPNFFISIVDGITGKELTHAELNYNELTDGNDSYGRDNRADYMNANYAAMEGHYGIAYLDGIHPSLVMECENRDKNGTHHGYVMTWDFDWDGGVASNWHHSHTWTRNNKSPLCAEFHQIRIIDSDGDGCDDMWTGSYGVNPKQNRFVTTGLPHGDRFILSDIDPERPGLEGFSIQQSALLGQCLYDISNGQRLREWHLPSVYDVGRGACMDIDPDNKGYEIYSFTDDYIYDCKGYKTAHTRSQNGITTMFEGLWWDGNLLREELSSPGGSGYSTNLMVTTVLGKKRLIEFSQESEWDVHGGTGTRPAFMGDIIGDWREEVILAIQRADSSTGLVGYTTNIPTNHSIYSLQQDPHYRLDCTTRGYYQHPNTGFYLGTEMALPPIPPILTTDLRWKGGSWENGFISYDMQSNCNYSDGKSLMFDLSGDNSVPITITNKIMPSAICLMNPKGHDYIFNDAHLAGNMTLTKSMLGTVVINGNLSYTGRTIISEGCLIINGNIDSPIELRAKGTLGGNATVRGDISFEGALNHEGCRLKPTGNNGVISFNKDLILPGNIYIELEAGNGTCGKLAINGNLDFKGVNTFTINGKNLTAGNYVLAECTNVLNAEIANLMIRGLEDVNYELKKETNKLVLVVKETRGASSNVIWTGLESNEWNYKANNFTLNGSGTSFVANDEVVFNDKSSRYDITIDDMVKPASIVFESGTYTFSGEGGISGEGHVTINKNANVTF